MLELHKLVGLFGVGDSIAAHGMCILLFPVNILFRESSDSSTTLGPRFEFDELSLQSPSLADDSSFSSIAFTFEISSSLADFSLRR